MSGDTIGTAMDALFLLAGGLGFARFGWSGLRRPAPAPVEAGAEASAPSRASTGWQIFSALLLLFGGFVALCGLLLGLSLVLPG
ncbi:MAG: hypothetical protein JO013_01300 [Alphaproteobacteria bacterium]|nr:hypothetical protein [Alphaproteobacteria bacterium]